MNIKNKDLASFISDLNNDNLTVEKIDIFGDIISVDGLLELFDLIENEKTDFFTLKVYSTVYDKEKIKELEKFKNVSHINAIFAEMWHIEAINNNETELSSAKLGFVIFGSDLIERIKNGYDLMGYSKDVLNNQIHSLIRYFSLSIQNKTFLKDLTQIEFKENDDSLFNTKNTDFDSIKKIKDRIELSNLIINKDPNIKNIVNDKYPNISNDQLGFLSEKDLEYFSDNKVKLNYKKELKIDNEDDSIYLEGLNTKFENKIENTFNPFDTDKISDFEVLQNIESESSFLSFLKSFLNPKKQNNSGIKLKTLRNKNNKRKGTSFKITVSLFFFIALVGLGIVAATQKSKVVEDETIAEKIIDTNMTKKTFSINRNDSKEE